MKLRIKGNSVRIRLSRSEVAAFAKEGHLEEKTDFINGTLTYSVQSTDAQTLSADYSNGNLIVFVPGKLLMKWASTNLVGLNYNMPLTGEGSLFILLEKDFKCIDTEETEDQSDYFENPLISC